MEKVTIIVTMIQMKLMSDHAVQMRIKDKEIVDFAGNQSSDQINLY